MPKILIFKNPELFKAISQLQVPFCNFMHSENTDIEISEEVIAAIGNIDFLQSISSRKFVFIAIVDRSEKLAKMELPAGVFLVKRPYHLSEIIEVVQSIISQADSSSLTLQIGNFAFIVDARKLLKNGHEIALTQKEAEFILLLYNADGQVVSKEEILKKVWEYNHGVDTHTLETHIYRIRQKVGKDDDFICSAEGGYFLRKSEMLEDLEN